MGFLWQKPAADADLISKTHVDIVQQRPFGIYGLVIFMWIIAAGSLYLYKNFQHGLPELKVINGFLFACFTAHAIFFFAIFGAIAFELYVYTGILGLSVALNTRKTPEPAPEGNLALQT